MTAAIDARRRRLVAGSLAGLQPWVPPALVRLPSTAVLAAAPAAGIAAGGAPVATTGAAGGSGADTGRAAAALRGLMTPWQGPRPPSPELIDLARRPASLKTYSGRWLLLNLWATWCGPCKEEMPSLDRLRARLAPRGPEVLAISLGDSINQIENFVEQTPVALPILIDHRRQMMNPAWQGRILPTTYLLDPGGIVRFIHVGARQWDDAALVAALETLSSN